MANIRRTPEAARKHYLVENEDELVEFDGQNCNEFMEEDDEPCGGWWVGEHRCECGERRVYLGTYGDEKTGYFAFPTAY